MIFFKLIGNLYHPRRFYLYYGLQHSGKEKQSSGWGQTQFPMHTERKTQHEPIKNITFPVLMLKGAIVNFF